MTNSLLSFGLDGGYFDDDGNYFTSLEARFEKYDDPEEEARKLARVGIDRDELRRKTPLGKPMRVRQWIEGGFITGTLYPNGSFEEQ
jgi:hypothetical protein